MTDGFVGGVVAFLALDFLRRLLSPLWGALIHRAAHLRGKSEAIGGEGAPFSPPYHWEEPDLAALRAAAKPGVYVKSDEELAAEEPVEVREEKRWRGPKYD